jgi:hypothetical protein
MFLAKVVARSCHEEAPGVHAAAAPAAAGRPAADAGAVGQLVVAIDTLGAGWMSS